MNPKNLKIRQKSEDRLRPDTSIRRPFVSIIVPVYNDAENLHNCLKALQRQTYQAEHFEVVVVDNGSEKPIDTLVADFKGNILLSEATPGSYAARNTGIARARGDILAFLDSDCSPDTKWLANGLEKLAEAEIVGGRMVLVYKNPGNPTPLELFDGLTSFRQKEYVEKSHFSVTANLFAKRSVFDKIGTFDLALKSGGDCEWGNRAHAAGYTLAYADEAVVFHPARNSLKDMLKKHRRVAGGNTQRLIKAGKISWGKFIRAQIVEVLIFLRLFKETLFSGEIPSTKMLQVIVINMIISLLRILEPYRIVMGGKPSR